MIFKLLVADDEATMRKGIANFMNWASIECEVVGTASDGAEAIEFIRQNEVDIIITDIKMPIADGLEVAKYVSEHHLDIKVILLTGYADFAYAQTAIRYNVSSFLLKPTNKKDLFEAVQEAQKALITSKKNNAVKKEELAFLKDQLLQELTTHPATPELTERMEHLGLSLEHYYVAAFGLLNSENDISPLKEVIISEERNAYCYRYNQLIIAVYFVDASSANVPECILTNCSEIISIARNLASIDTAAGISCYHENAAEFGSAVSEAIYALTLNFYSEENIAQFSGISNNSSYDLTAENSINLLQLENHLHQWQFEDADTLLTNIFLGFRSNFINSADVKNICAQVYYICSRVLIQKKNPAPNTDYLSRIHSSSDIFTLEETAAELLKVTKKGLLDTSENQNGLIEHAKQYIHQHLAESLSLDEIAEYLHISPSHLSRTFKKNCEESLTEYINRSRIDKAKELLCQSDILTYEVAEQVGYHDPTYFSSIFKKYTGVSPSEFRH